MLTWGDGSSDELLSASYIVKASPPGNLATYHPVARGGGGCRKSEKRLPIKEAVTFEVDNWNFRPKTNKTQQSWLGNAAILNVE
jgi:hypothetical protein